MTPDFHDCLALFPWGSVTLTCPLPPEFADMPDLPDRLRGAIGNRLRDCGPGGDAALLHHLLHGAADPAGGRDLSRPVVLQTERRGNHLVITLHLAGSAANLMITAGHALRAALTGGIRMGTDIRYRIALDPSPPDFARHIGFSDNAPPRSDRLYLRLATPLCIRRGKADGEPATDLAGKPDLCRVIDTLPWNIESRFRRLAAQFHRPVAERSGIPRRLSDFLEPVQNNLHRETYLHFSTSHRNAVPITAVGGSVVFYGRCQPFLPLLAFARVFHAGSSTSFGLGRIEYAAT